MACNCTTNPCGCDSGISLPYLTGAAGNDGLFGGYSAEWKFDATTSTGPASTYLRFNNATLASVTEIYINDTNIDSVDHDLFLDSFDNSSVYGLVRIWKQHDSDTFWMGEITGVTDNGSDHTLTVTYTLANGTFTAEDNVVVSFAPKGATGATGSNGANGIGGSYVVDTDFTGSIAASTASPAVLGTVTVAADTLGSDEDMLEFYAYYTSTDSSAGNDDIYISFGDQGYAADSNERFASFRIPDLRACWIEGRIIRESSSVAHCVTKVVADISATGTTSDVLTPNATVERMGHQTLTVDWTQANIFEIGIDATAQEDLTLIDLVVKYVQKGA